MEEKNSIFRYYKKLIALRKKYDVFTEGSYTPVLLEDTDIFSYIRESNEENLLVVADFYVAMERRGSAVH